MEDILRATLARTAIHPWSNSSEFTVQVKLYKQICNPIFFVHIYYHINYIEHAENHVTVINLILLTIFVFRVRLLWLLQTFRYRYSLEMWSTISQNVALVNV